MGYKHRIVSATCPQCNRSYYWKREGWVGPFQAQTEWVCACGARNVNESLSEWPQVPRTLYAGHEKNQQVKIHPLPPEKSNEKWSQPYSIRSFVYQVSRRLPGCSYTTSSSGEMMGEPVFTDRCYAPDATQWDESHSCHMIAGWTLGDATCPLWESVAALCQTEMERRFLHWYLGFVKDRQFPMLIPQARIGITERRRPDFVLFVPVQYWNYNWYALQLDGAHLEDRAIHDELRDADIAAQGYNVIRVKPERSGYLNEVRSLVERIEDEMNLADQDPGGVAVEVKVKKSVAGTPEEEDVPF